MLIHASCPRCGESSRDPAEVESGSVRCPGCGSWFSLSLGRIEVVSDDDDITTWLRSAPPAGGAAEAVETCGSCGYEGPMLKDEVMAYPCCPACNADQRPGNEVRHRAHRCPECRSPVEALPGRTVICPGCGCFLGCLVRA